MALPERPQVLFGHLETNTKYCTDPQVLEGEMPERIYNLQSHSTLGNIRVPAVTLVDPAGRLKATPLSPDFQEILPAKNKRPVRQLFGPSGKKGSVIIRSKRVR